MYAWMRRQAEASRVYQNKLMLRCCQKAGVLHHVNETYHNPSVCDFQNAIGSQPVIKHPLTRMQWEQGTPAPISTGMP